MTKRKVTVFIALCTVLVTLFAADVQTKVYVTAKGKKYHRETCRTLKKTKHPIELTLKAATEKGYTACKVCKPPVEEVMPVKAKAKK